MSSIGWDIVNGILQFGGPVGLASGTYLAPSEAFAAESTLGFYRFNAGGVGLATTAASGGIFFTSSVLDNGQSTSPLKNRWGSIRQGDTTGCCVLSGLSGVGAAEATVEVAGLTKDASVYPCVQFTALKYTTANGLGQLGAAEHAFLFAESEGVTYADHIFWDMLGRGGVTHTIWPAIFSTSGIGAVSTQGYTLQSSALALVGTTVQYSPYFSWTGYGWTGSVSKSTEFRAEVVPTAAATPTALWRLGYSLDNAAASTVLSVNSVGNLVLLGKVTSFSGDTAVGMGVEVIRGNTRTVAATAAVSNLCNITVGAADSTYEVCANILVTTATTHAFTATCTYTDESNTARTLTLTFGLVAGGVTTTSIANGNGAVPYHGVPVVIRAKAGTGININTVGTFTTVTYNIDAFVKQLS